MIRGPPRSALFPNAPLFRSREYLDAQTQLDAFNALVPPPNPIADPGNRSLLVSLSGSAIGFGGGTSALRSEGHTSELQAQSHHVRRPQLAKNKDQANSQLPR